MSKNQARKPKGTPVGGQFDRTLGGGAATTLGDADTRSTQETRLGGTVWLDDGSALHRLGGPAVEAEDGYKEYWVHGRQVDEGYAIGQFPPKKPALVNDLTPNPGRTCNFDCDQPARFDAPTRDIRYGGNGPWADCNGPWADFCTDHALNSPYALDFLSQYAAETVAYESARAAKPKRRAVVRGARDAHQLWNYLPSNYSIESDNGDGTFTIAGFDNAGWNFEDYVQPRLLSGGMGAQEVADTEN